jgi:hypothetical protein
VLKFGAKETDSKYYTAMAYAAADDARKPFAKVEQAITNLAKEWGRDLKTLDTTGLRTGENKISKAEKPESYEYLRGKVFINPKKVDRNGAPKLFRYDPEIKGQVLLKDPEEIAEYFYRGAKVILSITLGTYDFAGKKGISMYLNNCMFVAHGNRIGGATGAEFVSEAGVDYSWLEAESNEDSAV